MTEYAIDYPLYALPGERGVRTAPDEYWATMYANAVNESYLEPGDDPAYVLTRETPADEWRRL